MQHIFSSMTKQRKNYIVEGNTEERGRQREVISREIYLQILLLIIFPLLDNLPVSFQLIPK